jgi:hypothetical protein
MAMDMVMVIPIVTNIAMDISITARILNTSVFMIFSHSII